MRKIFTLGILALCVFGCSTQVLNKPVQEVVEEKKTQTAVVRKPQEAAKYRLLGLEYQKEKRLSKAIKAMQKSVELDPENAVGKVNLGWALHLAQREEEARKVLEAAIEDHPSYVPGFNALGIVYLVTGELSKAVETHTRAIQLKDDNEIAHYNLSLAYHRLKEYDKGIKHGETASKLEYGNPHPFVALALNFWDKGDKKQSLIYYRQAVALDGRYRNRGYLSHLKKAGFSSAQIEQVKKILISYLL